MRSNNRNQRNQRGTILAELAIGCLVTVSVAMFGLDIGTAMVCYGQNDRACRDAARAAAQGSTQAEAQNLATSIVKTFANPSGLITSPQVVSVQYTDFNGTPPDGVSPFVTVTTRSTARPIAPFSLFGRNVINGTFPLRKTYTFPIVKLNVNA